MSRLGTILSALHGQPRTLSELSGDLGSSPAAVEGMLQTLFASGYVQDASPTADGCACNGCSLKSLCRNAAGDVPALNLLRLTEKGEKLLQKTP
ncbi:FeoC-like transcriptional regulator [Deinococcus sp. KNUC1210]|uniref:helix-turn-helix domain-containing protein n=1 Tax=Deinococcus sp. KNUC1210 TaxID=2917691 RepID=UPI001EF0F555|nr:FeoC-like transcriptional regulator [Deinococcus sp. KNUC1210]ULH14855.1 FeoC-like transcriptional regulator [Deinococcus sp. KNUC1210]